MPFTPFHLGPALFFGLLLLKVLDLPTFLVASIIVDLEPFFVISLGLDYPLHGFFHTFLGGTIAALALALVMYWLNGLTGRLMKSFRLGQESSPGMVLAASLLGVYTHILLDAPLYTDIRPFYPLDVNPLLFTGISAHVYAFCALLFLAGIALYFVRLALQRGTAGKAEGVQEVATKYSRLMLPSAEAWSLRQWFCKWL